MMGSKILILVAVSFLMACGDRGVGGEATRGTSRRGASARRTHSFYKALQYEMVAQFVRAYAEVVGNQGGFGPPDFTHTVSHQREGGREPTVVHPASELEDAVVGRWELRIAGLLLRLDVFTNGKFEYRSGDATLSLYAVGWWEISNGNLSLKPWLRSGMVIRDVRDGLSPGDLVALMLSPR